MKLARLRKTPSLGTTLSVGEVIWSSLIDISVHGWHVSLESPPPLGAGVTAGTRRSHQLPPPALDAIVPRDPRQVLEERGIESRDDNCRARRPAPDLRT